VTLNALSVDLEEYFHVSNLESVIDRADWDSLPSRVREPTQRLLDLFEECGVHSTFFVLGWVAERQPQLIREIAERGHEIACHGYAHELVYRIGSKRFREDVRRARRAIEDACGTAVVGYRAPSYSITESSLWALHILADEGFEFDSSIFPIRHPRYGIPDFSRLPVRLDLGSGTSLLEFPLSTLRVGPLNLPVAGGAYLRFCPEPLFRRALGRLVSRGDPTVLYLHPWEIDHEQPRHEVSLRVRINHYHNLHRMESRVRAVLSAFRFSPLSAVLSSLEVMDRLPWYEIAKHPEVA